MIRTASALASALVMAVALAPPASADSISEVEGARAHERSGHGLTRQEREKIRRYGSNDDGFYSGYRGYGGGYGYGPSVGISIGPGYGYGYGYSGPRGGYDGPYGY